MTRSHEDHIAERVHPRVPQRLWRSEHTQAAQLVDSASGATASSLTELDAALDVFNAARPRLFGIAYRMLGSVADAEDLVQEVWLRWQATDRADVRDPNAFLATVTTRLAINELQSARVRREAYVGPWLPEPIDTGAGPELAAETDETIQVAVLFILERLSASQRAAYVLREAFGYSYSQIADVIGSTESSARQLVSRARKRISAERGEPVPVPEHERFLHAFIDAARSGDLDSLESVLSEDVVSHSDGGSAYNAARKPIVGREHVVKFVAAVSSWFWDGVDVRWIEVNNRPAAMFVKDGEPFAICNASVTREGIEHLFWMMNPGKLGGAIYTEG